MKEPLFSSHYQSKMEQPNLNYIKELSDGDIYFEHKVIKVLKKELPLEYEEFLRSFKEKKFIKSAENVHKLKHKISILGLVNGYELASEFEANLKETQEIHLFKNFCSIIELMIEYIKPL